MSVKVQLFVILADAYMDVGDTIPWMESVESRLERRPRATHGDKAEAAI
jgi:hypothetical protein